MEGAQSPVHWYGMGDGYEGGGAFMSVPPFCSAGRSYKIKNTSLFIALRISLYNLATIAASRAGPYIGFVHKPLYSNGGS